MAKSKETTATPDNPTATGLAQLRQFDEAGLGPLRWMGMAWFETMAQMNEELVRFIAQRIGEDMNTQHALMHCKSPEEVRKTQAEFFEKAIHQYTEETGKLVEMSLDLMPQLQTGTKNTPV